MPGPPTPTKILALVNLISNRNFARHLKLLKTFCTDRVAPSDPRVKTLMTGFVDNQQLLYDSYCNTESKVCC